MEQERDPEDRLEAALERIARSVETPVIEAPDPMPTEVAARLDHIIATLREALGK